MTAPFTLVEGRFPSVLALIPARGGSKGVPRKNVRTLGGRPLIAHSIEAAAASRLVSSVVVSTEDEEIAAVSRTWGAKVVKRPVALAEDNSSSEAVIEHVLHDLLAGGENFQLLLLLQPTSPLRTTVHINQALRLYVDEQAGAVMSVTEDQHHPMKALKIEGGRLKPFFSAEALSMPRQHLPRAVRQNGAIYITSSEDFLRTKSLFVPPVVPYVMTPAESVDIDTEEDFENAGRLMTRR